MLASVLPMSSDARQDRPRGQALHDTPLGPCSSAVRLPAEFALFVALAVNRFKRRSCRVNGGAH
jgi:hypothetical protein